MTFGEQVVQRGEPLLSVDDVKYRQLPVPVPMAQMQNDCRRLDRHLPG